MEPQVPEDRTSQPTNRSEFRVFAFRLSGRGVF